MLNENKNVSSMSNLSEHCKLENFRYCDEEEFLTPYSECKSLLIDPLNVSWDQIIEFETDCNLGNYDIDLEYLDSFAENVFSELLYSINKSQIEQRYVHKNYVLSLVRADQFGYLRLIVLSATPHTFEDNHEFNFSRFAFQYSGECAGFTVTEVDRCQLIDHNDLERILVDYSDSFIMRNASRLQFVGSGAFLNMEEMTKVTASA